MRQQLNRKLIPMLQELFRLLRGSDTGRRASEDDGACGEGSSLREEADQFSDAEDKVATAVSRVFLGMYWGDRRAHVKGQSWRTRPFFKPRMWSLLASGTWAAEMIAGPDYCKHDSTQDALRRRVPIGQAVSNPFEKHHWLWFICAVRLEMSLAAVYPRT